MEAAFLGQLLGGERTLGSNSTLIETDEVIDAKIIDKGIVSRALTGEILAEIESVSSNGLGKLENAQIVL